MNSFYTTTLYPLQDRVFQVLKALHTPFYLTGGTALSRGYYNHRYSDDLDFFVNQLDVIKWIPGQAPSPRLFRTDIETIIQQLLG